GGARVYIPYTLPGETVRAELRGTRALAIEIEKPSPDRIEPLCKHFGICGGCALQHWSEARYIAWKAGLVREALARDGIEAPIEPLRTYPLSSRRRATFAARCVNGKIQLGYHTGRTHDIFDLEECPILLPKIVSALPHLKAALGAAMRPRSEAKIYLAAAANGLDCAIDGPSLPVGAQAGLVQALSAAGVIRASWNGEIVLLSATPFVSSGGVKAALPPGAFLQAAEGCERDMADWTLAALMEAKVTDGPLCDLFAGLGAFTFPAARLAPVTAFEENAHAVEALAAAAKAAKGIKPVAAIRRDLYRNPLGPLELNKFAGVIADPPREGAEAQCRALASSKVNAVVMLSCNPATFARDAAILLNGGVQLSRLATFDQFKFSAHVEIAGLFRRRSSKKGGLAPALKK
ncbi:MAG: class I SAM-dependent RNA methyltransferase, partial [Rhodomicrobium sp.]|nr:class I SAM-dependent RNA methyltransferase [Rhodomicrobium sp.]